MGHAAPPAQSRKSGGREASLDESASAGLFPLARPTRRSAGSRRIQEIGSWVTPWGAETPIENSSSS
jgi:hypothetical protein